MPELVLQRIKFDANATLGELTLDGEHLCYTLENRPPKIPGEKEPGRSRIPAGTHRLDLRGVGGFYNRYVDRYNNGGPMVEILLRGWSYVLFHIGNFHTDTAGCVLVGETHGEGKDGLVVSRSAAAYRAVYPALLTLARSGGELIVRDEG